MTTVALDRHQTNKKRPTKEIRNQINSFSITTRIDAQKMNHFIKHLKTFKLIGNATISQTDESVSIDVQTSNERLNHFVQSGIHHYPDVETVTIKTA